MANRPVYAYLGPAGTFSHEAMLRFADATEAPYDSVACDSIEEVFEMVDRGKATYGVAPIENALEGGVTATLDAFAFTTSSEILGETIVDVHHCLIAAPGTKLSDVKQLISHPQPIGQCRHFIADNLQHCPVTAANSTAESVRRAVETPGAAGIGTELAAKIYGGEIIARDIEDHFGNQTRFVMVGQGLAPRTGNDKTSLALFMRQDRAGVLLMILSEFAYADINLTYIQSRPLKRALGEYMFFVDLEGHVDDNEVKTALDCLRLKLREVRVLGSYPRASREE